MGRLRRHDRRRCQRDITVQDFGPAGTNPGELGLLLRVIDGPEGNETILLPVED